MGCNLVFKFKIVQTFGNKDFFLKGSTTSVLELTTFDVLTEKK